jgi:hypothetical protein
MTDLEKAEPLYIVLNSLMEQFPECLCYGDLPGWVSEQIAATRRLQEMLMQNEPSAEAVAATEREACAKHLREAAARIAPEGKRTNQYDRHMADVLNEKADELLKRSNV